MVYLRVAVLHRFYCPVILRSAVAQLVEGLTGDQRVVSLGLETEVTVLCP